MVPPRRHGRSVPGVTRWTSVVGARVECANGDSSLIGPIVACVRGPSNVGHTHSRRQRVLRVEVLSPTLDGPVTTRTTYSAYHTRLLFLFHPDPRLVTYTRARKIAIKQKIVFRRFFRNEFY